MTEEEKSESRESWSKDNSERGLVTRYPNLYDSIKRES